MSPVPIYLTSSRTQRFVTLRAKFSKDFSTYNVLQSCFGGTEKGGPQTYFERLKKVVHGHVSFGNHLAKCPKCPKPEKLGSEHDGQPQIHWVYTSFSGGHSLPTSSGEPWTACCKTYSSAKMGFDLGEAGEVPAAWGNFAAVHKQAVNHTELLKMMIGLRENIE